MAKVKQVYSVHPSMRMMADWVERLPAKTGRSLEEWIAHIGKRGPREEKGRREWLAKEHKLGTNTAWWLAEKSTRPETIAEETPGGYLKIAPRYVEEQYAGKKATLRPIYDALLRVGLDAGKDATACPCKTMVPLFREHVFAQIRPATNTRVDFGLALGALPESKITGHKGRIIATGGREKKDRITHRIAISRVDEVDDLLRAWAARAYELDDRK